MATFFKLLAKMDYKQQTKVSVLCCMKSGNDFKAVYQIQTENTIYVQTYLCEG